MIWYGFLALYYPRGGEYHLENFCSEATYVWSPQVNSMCCVNWNRRYLQDLSALANHQDFTDRCNIAVRVILNRSVRHKGNYVSYFVNRSSI